MVGKAAHYTTRWHSKACCTAAGITLAMMQHSRHSALHEHPTELWQLKCHHQLGAKQIENKLKHAGSIAHTQGVQCDPAPPTCGRCTPHHKLMLSHACMQQPRSPKVCCSVLHRTICTPGRIPHRCTPTATRSCGTDRRAWETWPCF